jgi:hypothetical protein
MFETVIGGPAATGAGQGARVIVEKSCYLRLRVSPEAQIALGARVKEPGRAFVGHQHELFLSEKHPGEEEPMSASWATP